MRPAGRRGVVTWAIGLLAFAALLPTLASAAPLRGKLDTSFGRRGRVLFGLGPTYADSAYTAMVREPDGSVLLLGQTERAEKEYTPTVGLLQRRLPNGALDPSFHGPKGEYFSGLALQSDGRILFGEGGGEYESRIRRLDPDGSPDAGYPKVTVPLREPILAVDGAGRTVVAGSIGIGGNCHDCVPKPVPTVARLLPNGAIDKSFGKEGFAELPFESEFDSVTGLVVGPEDSIAVSSESAVFELTAGGQPNPAFGKEGEVRFKGTIGGLTRIASGDLVVAGSSDELRCCGKSRSSFVVSAFRADGSLDPAWGSGGTTRLSIEDVDDPTTLTATPEGGVIVAGEASAANEKEGCSPCHFSPYLARLTATGAVDPRFANPLSEAPEAEREVGPLEGYSSRVEAISITPSGQVLLAGKGEGAEQATLTALAQNGALDAGFGAAGVAADREPLPSQTEGIGLATGAEGRLAVGYYSNAGAYSEAPALTAWTADGKRLRGYGGPLAFLGSGRDNNLRSDGAGRVYRLDGFENEVARTGADGKPDRGYGKDGEAALPQKLNAKHFVVRRNGAVLVIGHVLGGDPMALFELTPAGRPDRRFGHDGLVRLAWQHGLEAEALAAAFDRRGRIVLFGTVNRGTPLARLLPNGRLDKSFGNGGRLAFKPEIGTEHSTVSVARDGRIYLATSGDRGDTTIVRFLPNGTRDRSFGKGGIVRVENRLPLTNFFAAGRQLVLVSGNEGFGSSGYALDAFHRDGRPDRSFGKDGAVNHSRSPFAPSGAVREANGRIVIVGTDHPEEPGAKLELLRFR